MVCPAAPMQVQEQDGFHENRFSKNRQLPRFARKGGPHYSFRRLAIHFSRIAWLGGSISVKVTPIPEFGLEWTTLPRAAKLVPPWVILNETFVPSMNGSAVYT
jgi:hypothetical protein